MRNQLFQQLRADWSVTKGMDSNAVLKDFPYSLKADVLKACYSTLLETNPPFLRCSEQLRLQILTLLKPGIALKKQALVLGGHFSATVYVLIKGTLQVSIAQGFEEESQGERSQSTRAPSKGRSFKDKLKVRMLERTGAIIPHAFNIYEGPKASAFNVSSVLQSRFVTFDAKELVRILDQHDEFNSEIVAGALSKEYLGLVDSLKGRSLGKCNSGAIDVSVDVQPTISLKARACNIMEMNSTRSKSVEVTKKLETLERGVEDLSNRIALLKTSSATLPLILGELTRRFVPPERPPGQDNPDDSARDESPNFSSKTKAGLFG